MKPTILILAAVLLIRCGGSPTEPRVDSLSGTFQGELRAFPFDENWSNVVLTVQTTGDQVTGTLTPAGGRTHSVTGRRMGSTFVLQVNDLPQQSPCRVSLNVTNVSSGAIEGDLGGRCPNTLISRFVLMRVR